MIRFTEGVILLCLIAVGAFFHANGVSTDAYDYDEADYMFAASKGFYANYTDQGALPFTTFIQLGIERGFGKDQRTSLSELVRKSGDITFYRHYHGPLYFYALTLFRGLFREREYAIRSACLLFLFLAAIAA